MYINIPRKTFQKSGKKNAKLKNKTYTTKKNLPKKFIDIDIFQAIILNGFHLLSLI